MRGLVTVKALHDDSNFLIQTNPAFGIKDPVLSDPPGPTSYLKPPYLQPQDLPGSLQHIPYPEQWGLQSTLAMGFGVGGRG